MHPFPDSRTQSFTPNITNPPSKAHTVPWIASALVNWVQIHFSALGILCASYFMVRMVTGRSSLPLSLNVSLTSSSEQEADWRRIWIFVWFSMTCSFLAFGAGELPLYGLALLIKDLATSPATKWLVWMRASAGTAVMAGLAAWAIRNNRLNEMRRFLKLPPASDVASTVVIVGANWSFLRLIMYAHDRVVWAATEFGKFEAPRLGMYFLAPQRSLFAEYLPAALFEEIIYSGCFQPRFVRRYGILRGLVILGLVWGAYHFR